MTSVEIRTPAKVNLVLDVLRKRDDGFHEISSLMAKVGLYDRLVFETAPAGVIHVTCDAPDVPTDERNLVYQAAAKLGAFLGRSPGCGIHIEKRIPVAAGLGGGSGNACGALRGLNQIWNARVPEAELIRIGAELGSDVPFFFGPEGAIVSERGDCVEPVRLSWNGWVALVFGGLHVSTAQVYGQCSPRSPERYREKLIELCAVDSADGLRAEMRNGLEDAVFAVAPRVKELRDRVYSACGRALRVSGAGAVLFDVFDTESEAHAFAEHLRARGVTEQVCVVRAPVSD